MAYLKQAFEPTTLEHAKNIALTPDPSWPAKFKEETDYLVRVIEMQGLLARDSLVLDFGCGMGRVARRMIEVFGCRVVGTDTSEKMLAFAREYAASERFEARASFEEAGTADLAVASLVLQHAEDPKKEVDSIHNALKGGGHLVLLDDGKRFVPSGVDAQGYVEWRDDGIVIEQLVAEKFSLVSRYPYPNHRDMPLSLWKKKIL